jgi:hypothetical protein
LSYKQLNALCKAYNKHIKKENKFKELIQFHWSQASPSMLYWTHLISGFPLDVILNTSHLGLPPRCYIEHISSQASPSMLYWTHLISGFPLHVILNTSHLRLPPPCYIEHISSQAYRLPPRCYIEHISSRASPSMLYWTHLISGFPLHVILNTSHLMLPPPCYIEHISSQASPSMLYCSEKSFLTKQINDDINALYSATSQDTSNGYTVCIDIIWCCWWDKHFFVW